MLLLDPASTHLIIIDLQARLMPAIHDGARVLANAWRLAETARLLDIPTLLTEQNPAGLGHTIPEIARYGSAVTKMSFDACGEPGFLAALPDDDEELLLCGCEAHVCLGQTALGLLALGRRVIVVQDAVGSRAPQNKMVALQRLERHGAEIVTTEMVVFEWLRTAEHPRFREVLPLVK